MDPRRQLATVKLPSHATTSPQNAPEPHLLTQQGRENARRRLPLQSRIAIRDPRPAGASRPDTKRCDLRSRVQIRAEVVGAKDKA
jgi:hypothetical protein